jgi:DNA-binding transcriptional ArsR family regulator
MSLRDRVRPLTALVAPRGDFPDFLTPPAEQDVEAAIETAVSTPRHRIRQEIRPLAAHRRDAGWLRSLAYGGRESLADLARALTAYQCAVVDAHRHRIDHVVDADRELRVRDLLSGGAERLLSNLPPPIVWRSPVLHADYPLDRDIHLGGRGLTLIPSYFCWGRPVTLIDPDLPPVLVYPATGGAGRPDSGAGDPRRYGLDLARLLGPARARVLHALRTPSSTSELARRSSISVTSASKHATVLRHTGLVSSVRRGNTVIHSLTRLGHELLAAGVDQPPAWYFGS